MNTQRKRLADALSELAHLQDGGRRVFRTAELRNEHRTCLEKNGFLQPIIQGWIMSADPLVGPQDSTMWHASFWDFCTQYCAHRFGQHWHLSPDLSLLLHAENTTVPQRIVVHTTGGNNNRLDLPFGASLFDLQVPSLPDPGKLCTRKGARLYTVEAALIHVSKRFFRDHPVEAQTALAGISHPGGVIRLLLEGGHSTRAGRLAGALRHMGRTVFADEIARAVRNSPLRYRETNPFVESDDRREALALERRHSAPPITHRLERLWQSARGTILDAFPTPPGLPRNEHDKEAYLTHMRQAYAQDAYHSLSIEGYRVTPELIERVATGAWRPDEVQADHKERDALAARGYWQATQEVRKTVERILNLEPPGERLREDHAKWYYQMFQPCVVAGLIDEGALFGYRRHPVYLRGSMHVPPRHEILDDAMDALFTLVQSEPEPAVRAVAGHWMFGYVHPYPDGNGRIARFSMNAMLAAGGYPWTIVRMEDRTAYLGALEAASVRQDVAPFATFVADRVRAGMGHEIPVVEDAPEEPWETPGTHGGALF